MRKIFLVTERRADYSRFKPILELIKHDDLLDYCLIVTGIHLLEEHGLTINEIKDDGFKIYGTFEMFKDDLDSGTSMVKSLGNALIGITKFIDDYQPDIILSGFDIAANLAVTIAGAHMNIPVAHIQGGEVTGTIDESIRHAMSKFAHYHFAANEDACQRLIKLGEKPEHVFNVGCPSIDAILQVDDYPNILKKYNLNDNFFLVLQHPVTTEFGNSKNQILNTVKAVKKSGVDALFILPNNDAGFSEIINVVTNSGFKHVETLPLKDYVNLMKRSIALIGNSSSGIHETASFDVYTINIGTRQQGRLRSNNIIDVDYDEDEIYKAIEDIKTRTKVKFEKIYGDGDSSKKIVDLLKTLSIDKEIIQKQITY